MRFWHICAPGYESDYQASYINGELEHPFGMPGIDCDVCHEKWGGSRILPFECPSSLRNNPNIRNRWPISLKLHKSLREQVTNRLLEAGINCPPLKPGDSFQPCYLDVPSKPRADFLWANHNTLVISERIKGLFATMNVQSVVFCEVTLRKIGKRNAKLPAPIPSTSEPEDLIKELPLLVQIDSIGRYFEVLIQFGSRSALGVKPVTVCSGCGRETFRNDEDRFIMKRGMWDGTDIFYLPGTLRIVITDKLKQALQKLNATNVDYKPCLLSF